MATLSLDQLNPEQRAAVLAPDGPILILAGAGSGKTRVLTHRVAWLLAEGRAFAGGLLAVTFTNKAAAEMRDRIAALIGSASEAPWVSTFHSACARILRREARAAGFEPNFSIFDERDSMRAVRRIVEEAVIAGVPPPEAVRARIEQAKNEALGPDELAARAQDGQDRAVAEIYHLYQDHLRAMNAMDFGDLQFLTWRLFERDAEVLRRWQHRTRHLLVDEYQDTNRVQYLLVRALSRLSGNLCVVGDEDQSIYGWRGADIRNILDFSRDFPAARVFKLEQNYRSTKTILAAADAVISHNRERKVKNLWTENDPGRPVTCYTAGTERDEAAFVAREIARLVEAGEVTPGDVVVFYRVNAQSRVIEEALVRRGLPYYVVGGVRFYEHREVKDLLAYLKVIANPADGVSLERLIGVPPRGIGKKTVAVLRELAARRGITMFEALGRLAGDSRATLRSAKRAGELYGWMRDLMVRAEETGVRTILDEVIAHSGFITYLDAMADAETRRQNVLELQAAAAAFDTEGGPARLAEFLEQVALVTEADRVDSAGGQVALMTLHTAKGLEYPLVFITGMEEGLFPHSRSQTDSADVEEERRLCYVGMTRAQRLLYLTNTRTRELYGTRQESRPSRFLLEIDQSLLNTIDATGGAPPLRIPESGTWIDYSESQIPCEETAPAGIGVGARVTHQTFGTGVVHKLEGRGETKKAWVQFERAGLKLLMLKFAGLRAIAE